MTIVLKPQIISRVLLLGSLILFASVPPSTLWAQDILLLTESFETGGSSISINNGGPGSNTGNNQWIVNNSYSGAPTYPNTTTQDNTVSGTIGFAPTSNYLHIHDQPSGITNNNYAPSAVSDQFAYTQFGLCTYGMIDVHFSFFWLCEGNADAYGTIYYSTDGGPWTSIGLAQYTGSSNWQYSDITNPAFSNVGSLRFGFRWQNNNAGPPFSQSFSIDDINIVATLSVQDPVTITVTSVTPNPVCQGNFITVSYELSDTLCDGNYQIELSNSSGNFPSPFGGWVIPINYPTTSGSFTIQLPANAPVGGCYTIRINRSSPAPQITGIASGCFEIISCPNVIVTLPPVIATDPFPVCSGSAIDVPFTSTGIYLGSNTYICQLSGPDGIFAASPPVVGTYQNNGTYDPALGQLPGNVSGLVPTVTVPGCNYYLRVISTNPSAIGTPWGPFCIQLCDIQTNNTLDIDFCVYDCDTDANGENTNIAITINSYGNTANYLPGNVFTTQLFSSLTFAQIGADGILGSVVATSSTQLNIHIPCLDSLAFYGIPLGMNYLRIVSTNSSTPGNMLGTLIRVTIGAFALEPQIITSYDYPSGIPNDVFCVGETAMLLFNPYSFADNSTYRWRSNGINGGQPFVSPSGANSNSLFVTLGVAGVLTFAIEQTNYGCVTPWTPDVSITVLGDPIVNITGPVNVCLGETNLYQVNFTPETYYSWSTNAPPTSIAYQDTSNNVMNIGFSTLGNYTLYVNVLNQCGSANDNHLVHVLPPPNIAAGPDTLLCIGQSTQLSTPTGAGYSYAWSNGTSNLGTTNSIIVAPTQSTYYYATVTSLTGSCTAYDTAYVEIQFPDSPFIYTDSICQGGNPITLEADSVGTYTWSTGSSASFININSVGTYDLSIDIPGQLCPRLVQYNVGLTQPEPPFVYVDSICPGGQNRLNLLADSVGTYLWGDGSTLSSLLINDVGIYNLNILQPNAFCPRLVQYNVLPMLPDAPIQAYDSVCPGGYGGIILQAGTPGLYQWSTGSTASYITVTDVGMYSVNIYIFNQRCPESVEFTITPDTCYVDTTIYEYEELFYYVPNAFTADANDVNDVFGPVFSNSDIVRDYNFTIFDRWGSLVFISTDPKERWTGNKLGGDFFVADGAYVWLLKFRNKYEVDPHGINGHVIIFR